MYDLLVPAPQLALVAGFPAGAGLEAAWGGTFAQITGMPASLDITFGQRWKRNLGPWGEPYLAAAAYAWSTPLLFGGSLHIAPGPLVAAGWWFPLPGGRLKLAVEAGAFLLWVPAGSEGNQSSFTPGPRLQMRLGWGG